jgi:hypothetical protein
MNCFVPHLMQYTLAKIVEAVNREDRNKAEQMEVAKLDRMHLIWCSMLDAMGMTAQTGSARLAADALFSVTMQRQSGRTNLTRDEAESLRCWFQGQIH